MIPVPSFYAHYLLSILDSVRSNKQPAHELAANINPAREPTIK